MFGIGLGEIIIILLVIFFISPKEIPKFLKKLGQFFAAFNRIKDELLQINNEVKDIINEDTQVKSENNIDDKAEVYKNLEALNKRKKPKAILKKSTVKKVKSKTKIYKKKNR